MVLGAYMEICVTGHDCFWRNPYSAKMTKNCQNEPKIGFLDVLGKSIHYFGMEMVYNEVTYDSSAFCENFIFGKNVILKL